MDKETAQKRAQITQKIRDFFNKEGFTEVETPIMTHLPGMEPHLTPFETKLNLPSQFTQSSNTTTSISAPNHCTVFLNHSPELQMKKLLSQGYGNIFTLTKTFRNGEIGSKTHNPEFTMLEWYRENADYTNIMTDCENLITYLTASITKPSKKFTPPPWPRITTNELFQRHCQINLLQNKTYKQFLKTAQTNPNTSHHNFDTCQNWDDIFFKIFLNEIEPHLSTQHQALQPDTQTSTTSIPDYSSSQTTFPTFVMDYPSSQAALAKISTENPFFAERFELYINGIELANAFSELTDPEEQYARLKKEQSLRHKLEKSVFRIDEEFIKAVTILHSTGKNYAGIALGIDRLMMILLNKSSINEVIQFSIGDYI